MPLDVKIFKRQNLIHYRRWVNQKPCQSEQPHLHCNYGDIASLEILQHLFCISTSIALHCHHCVLSNHDFIFLILFFPPQVLVGCITDGSPFVIFYMVFTFSVPVRYVHSFHCICSFFCSASSVHFINMIFTYLSVFFNTKVIGVGSHSLTLPTSQKGRFTSAKQPGPAWSSNSTEKLLVKLHQSFTLMSWSKAIRQICYIQADTLITDPLSSVYLNTVWIGNPLLFW